MGYVSDWSAIVSAGAAVVQAVGAGAAIWYSGKLARDGAKREREADAAAQQRLDEARKAAEEQRRLDREAVREADEQRERDAYNKPLRLVIDLAAGALAGYRTELENAMLILGSGRVEWHSLANNRAQQLFADRAPALLDEIGDGSASVAVHNLIELIRPSDYEGRLTAREWVEALTPVVAEIDQTIHQLVGLLR